jgi:hypothetical protein
MPKPAPKMDLKRPMSWSSMSSFEYDPEQWWQKYVLHGKCKRADLEKDFVGYCEIMGAFWMRCPQVETSYEMEFGKIVGEKLASDPAYLPHMPRLSVFEYKLETKFDKIPLIGYIDSLEPYTELDEFKTGRKIWDQKRADNHGQIDFYLLCLYLMHKVRPEDVKCHLRWMPTQQNGDFSISFINEKEIKSFETKRTMRDILEFGNRIKNNYQSMQLYAATHP